MNAPKYCANCSTRLTFGARKCRAAGCGASVRFARCETVEEAAARNAEAADMSALLSELTGGAL
jgi:hypothetical protein